MYTSTQIQTAKNEGNSYNCQKCSYNLVRIVKKEFIFKISGTPFREYNFKHTADVFSVVALNTAEIHLQVGMHGNERGARKLRNLEIPQYLYRI